MEREPQDHAPETAGREPVLAYGGIAAVVGAVLGVLVAFGVNVSDEQTRALLTLLAALMPFVPALFAARSKVTPTGRR